MIFIYIIGVIFIAASLGAIILAVAASKARRATTSVRRVKPNELDAEQAAVTASTWTSLNPPI